MENHCIEHVVLKLSMTAAQLPVLEVNQACFYFDSNKDEGCDFSNGLATHSILTLF